MNKEINAIDLAIEKLQEEKNKILKKEINDKKDKQEKSKQKITPKDKILIKELSKKAKWWRDEGPKVKKTIKITIEANILWTENTEPHVDGYEIMYNGKSFDFDELIRSSLFEKDLEKYQKQISRICDLADKLEKKYPDANIEDIFI